MTHRESPNEAIMIVEPSSTRSLDTYIVCIVAHEDAVLRDRINRFSQKWWEQVVEQGVFLSP